MDQKTPQWPNKLMLEGMAQQTNTGRIEHGTYASLHIPAFVLIKFIEHLYYLNSMFITLELFIFSSWEKKIHTHFFIYMLKSTIFKFGKSKNRMSSTNNFFIYRGLVGKENFWWSRNFYN